MKLKFLFSSMLFAGLLVGCNNDVVGPDGGSTDGPGSEPEGISTTATFQFNFAPATYSGNSEESGQGAENTLGDATLTIYKLDGTPEAMGYIPDVTVVGVNNKVTLRCYSGTKLIYLAVNTGLTNLIKSGATAGNTSDPAWLGVDWTAAGYPGVKFPVLNSPLFSQGTGATFASVDTTTAGWFATTMSAITLPAKVNGLLTAVANNGVASGTAPSAGESGGGGTIGGTKYLMTNWGDNSSQSDDDVVTGTTYLSTCKFALKPSVSATDSRAAASDYFNNNQKNALKINIQRALSKFQLKTIAPGVLSSAGTSPVTPGIDNTGVFAPESKWAVGNISMSEYPFQQWSGQNLKGTLFDSTSAIISSTNWEKLLDNSRWVASGQSYKLQNLTTTATLGAISGAAENVTFGNARVYVTENSNRNTLNAWTSFIVFGGKYQPNNYVSSVDQVGNLTFVSGAPAADPAIWTGGAHAAGLDTMYYIQETDTTGIFIFSDSVLYRYVGWAVLHTSATYDPAKATDGTASQKTDSANIRTYIDNLRKTSGNVPASLQAYYHDQCFYRVFVRDAYTTNSINKRAVRRNHIYAINISDIKSPGIGDPNDIIDPHPEEPEPLEEAETWVTADIVIMNWHIVEQDESLKLE
jgi:hypothetical protein